MEKEKEKYFKLELERTLLKCEKNELIDSIIKIFDKKHLYEDNFVLETFKIDPDSFLLDNKENIINELNKIDELIVESDSFSGEAEFESRSDRDFIQSVCDLISALYNRNEYGLAAKIIKKLFSINFINNYYDLDEDTSDTKSYKLYDLINEIETCLPMDEILETLLKAGIEEKNYSYMDILLRIIPSFNFKESIKRGERKEAVEFLKEYLSHFLAKYKKGTNYEVFTLFDNILKYIDNQKFNYEFLKNNIVNHPYIIEVFVNNIDDSIDLSNEIDYVLDNIHNKRDYMSVLESIIIMKGYKKYIVKYYEMTKGLEGFLVLMNIYDDKELFNASLREEDRKYLDLATIESKSIDEIMLLNKIVYNSYRINEFEEFTAVIKKGISKYIDNFLIDRNVEDNINKLSLNYFVDAVKNASSSEYHRIIFEIKNFRNETKSRYNILVRLAEIYSKRTALVKLINNR